MKILNPTTHGAIDYAAAIALIIAPFIFGFSGIALYLSVAAGVALIFYSLFTDYAFSIGKLLPFKAHLAIDLAAGAAFVIAPFLFGFTGLTQIYYFVMGGAVILVVLTTSSASPTKPGA